MAGRVGFGTFFALLLLSVILLQLTIGAPTAYVDNFNEDSGEEEYEVNSSFDKSGQVGHSKGWKEVAGNLLNNYNPSINPCYDFYEFVCGGFVKKHPGGSATDVAELRISSVLNRTSFG